LHGVINGTSIIIEDAGEFLTEFNLDRGELAGSAGVLGVLLFLAINGCGVGMWRVLGLLWWGVLESSKGLGDIIGHGEVNSAILVIPI